MGTPMCFVNATVDVLDSFAQALKKIVEAPEDPLTKVKREAIETIVQKVLKKPGDPSNLIDRDILILKTTLNLKNLKNIFKNHSLNETTTKEYLKAFDLFAQANDKKAFMLNTLGVSEKGINGQDPFETAAKLKEIFESLITITSATDKITVNQNFEDATLQCLEFLISSVTKNNTHIISDYLLIFYNLFMASPDGVGNISAALAFSTFYYLSKMATAIKNDPDWKNFLELREIGKFIKKDESDPTLLPTFDISVKTYLDKAIKIAHPEVLTKKIVPWLVKKINAFKEKSSKEIEKISADLPQIKKDWDLFKQTVEPYAQSIATESANPVNDYKALYNALDVAEKSINNDLNRIQQETARFTSAQLKIEQLVQEAIVEIPKKATALALSSYCNKMQSEIDALKNNAKLITAGLTNKLNEIADNAKKEINTKKQASELKISQVDILWEALRQEFIGELWTKFEPKAKIGIIDLTAIKNLQKKMVADLKSLTTTSLLKNVLNNSSNSLALKPGKFSALWMLSTTENEYNSFIQNIENIINKNPNYTLTKDEADSSSKILNLLVSLNPLLLKYSDKFKDLTINPNDLPTVNAFKNEVSAAAKNYSMERLKLLRAADGTYEKEIGAVVNQSGAKTLQTEETFKKEARNLLDGLYYGGWLPESKIACESLISKNIKMNKLSNDKKVLGL